MSSVEDAVRDLFRKKEERDKAILAFKDLFWIYLLWIPGILFNAWYFKTIFNWFLPTILPGAVVSYAWCLAALAIFSTVYGHVATSQPTKEYKHGYGLQRILAVVIFKLTTLAIFYFIHLWFF